MNSLRYIPLQNDVSTLQQQLAGIETPTPDEATTLIMEVANITGLPFDYAATLVVSVISIMLDAAGLYFLYQQQTTSAEAAPGQLNTSLPQPTEVPQLPDKNLHTGVHSNVNLSKQLGVDDILYQALHLIESGEIKPSVRSLTDAMELPQHTAQTILYWLAEAGYLHRQPNGKGYMLATS